MSQILKENLALKGKDEFASISKNERLCKPRLLSRGGASFLWLSLMPHGLVIGIKLTLSLQKKRFDVYVKKSLVEETSRIS